MWQSLLLTKKKLDINLYGISFEIKIQSNILKQFTSHLPTNINFARNTKLPKLPPLPEQKAIAKVLTAFDDKIELLQAQNKTLETMAQTIFKEWFGKYQIGDESA